MSAFCSVWLVTSCTGERDSGDGSLADQLTCVNPDSCSINALLHVHSFTEKMEYELIIL